MLSSVTALMVSLGLITAMASPMDDNSQPSPTDPSAYTDPACRPDPGACSTSTPCQKPTRAQLELIQWRIRRPQYGAHRQRAAARPANLGQVPHQRQAQPVVRCAALHPAIAAVRRIRAREAGPDHAGARADLPCTHPRRGPAPRPQRSRAQRGKSARLPEAFLQQPGLYPFPTQYRQCAGPQPLEGADRDVPQPPAGRLACRRPAAEEKPASHQRIGTSSTHRRRSGPPMAGARINLGLRDRKQLHNYAVGGVRAWRPVLPEDLRHPDHPGHHQGHRHAVFTRTCLALAEP